MEKLSRLLRYYSLVMSTTAGSGHPTSSLSAADLMAALMFGGVFCYDPVNPQFRNNDRLIFSKGHASPLFYSLWTVAGAVDEQELMTYRQFGSALEGHPTPRFPFTEAATGSLGQGLSVGLGMALGGKYLDRLPYRTYVLLGDSEMAEGAVWEAIQLAAYYKLDNLVGIIDVNRLGQRGETMYGHEVRAYEERVKSFGWSTIVIDGHNLEQILKAYKTALTSRGRPAMIIAHTIKGKGVTFLENQDGWHGKVVPKERLGEALAQLCPVDKSLRGTVQKPPRITRPSKFKAQNFSGPIKVSYKLNEPMATRKAYGNALVRIAVKFRDLVVLDAEVSNSTYAEIFKKHFPERFFEMYIAEQNMVATAVGLARRGKLPFVSTFAAFFTRAFDQIRLSAYSDAHIVFAGSHSGVAVGQDGASQMGLEDIALFRSIFNSIVLYPADATACDKLVEEAAKYRNIVYIRTTRQETPVIYPASERFPVGGSKVLRHSRKDVVTIVAAGITVHEALGAAEELANEKIFARVIDLYSVKPLDRKTLLKAAKETRAIVTVEDHYPEGGLGEAVASALADTPATIRSLAVHRLPMSGTPEELLQYEGISRRGIVKEVHKVLKRTRI